MSSELAKVRGMAQREEMEGGWEGTGMDTGQREGAFCLICTLSKAPPSPAPWAEEAPGVPSKEAIFFHEQRPNLGAASLT
jgi:hypothetical protein